MSSKARFVAGVLSLIYVICFWVFLWSLPSPVTYNHRLESVFACMFLGLLVATVFGFVAVRHSRWWLLSALSNFGSFLFVLVIELR